MIKNNIITVNVKRPRRDSNSGYSRSPEKFSEYSRIEMLGFDLSSR